MEVVGAQDVRKRGFTLIELLVVIAIIAILAAILFPVFSAARERGKMAKCQGHMKQLGTAVQMYISDNSERMPWQAHHVGPSDALGTGASTPNWAASLFRYVKSRTIFRCPSSVSRMTMKDPAPIPEIVPTDRTQISYMFNGIAIGKPLSACGHTTKTVLLREIQWYYGVGWLRPEPNGVGCWDAWYQMHFDGNNFVHADGHLRFVKLNSTPGNSNDVFWNFDDRSYTAN